MPEAKRVVIVGGGIAGLSAAHAAMSRAREQGLRGEVTVVEGTARFGGNVRTENEGGFVLDVGPDSWVASKPQATALARELGLESSMIGTLEGTRRYYVAWAGALHPVPEGLVLGVPTKLAPLARTRLFSWRGKLRMAFEPLVSARRFEGDEDESVAEFAARRLGREAAERLVAPLLGGIFASDAGDVSVRAAFPQLVTMERDHGSLVRGMRAQARASARSTGQATSAFVSLRQGVGGLVDALAERLQSDGVTLRAGAVVRAIERRGGGWKVVLDDGTALEAGAVVLAVPAHAAAPLVAPLDEPIATNLRSIPFGSTATVFLGYPREAVAHPLDGVGFVVPRSLGRPILASTWVSSKWPGRAPQGHVLLRVFFGGAWGEGVLARDDAGLIDLAREELRALMGLDATPVLARVYRFQAASARMQLGHLVRMREVRERLARIGGGLRLAGGGYDGVGIPDCIKQGQEAGRDAVTA